MSETQDLQVKTPSCAKNTHLINPEKRLGLPHLSLSTNKPSKGNSLCAPKNRAISHRQGKSPLSLPMLQSGLI